MFVDIIKVFVVY